ncbi:hypothetical protein BB561_000602 [Smittium simulii]|uniref:Dymeclin n=1 Tax=Smittium simulii TaxID=133385 RepID=A0A2T9YYH0_9FUNG|nr:hypothetical protein BB561_000602 [Smittium simulii]
MANEYLHTCPSHWDKNSYDFLIKIVSVTTIPLDNASFWLKSSSSFSAPLQETREQMIESQSFYSTLAEHLLANGPLTGNLQYAMYHCLIQMRYLKTIDFTTDITEELRGLSLAILILLKSSIIIADYNQLKALFKEKHIPTKSIENLTTKFELNQDSQVYIHALNQLSADSCNFFAQYLQYVILSVCKVDISKSFKSQSFVHYSIDLLLAFVQTEINSPISLHVSSISDNYILSLLYNQVGTSFKFNSNINIAGLLILKLLSVIINPQEYAGGYGSVVYNTYCYWLYGDNKLSNFTSSGLKSKAFALLMILVSQQIAIEPKADNFLQSKNDSTRLANVENINPFFAAFRLIDNEKQSRLDSSISFLNLYDTLIANLKYSEYIFVFCLLITTNKFFCEYCIARSDSENLILAILKVLGGDFKEALSVSNYLENTDLIKFYPKMPDRNSSFPASAVKHQLQSHKSSSRSLFDIDNDSKSLLKDFHLKSSDIEKSFSIKKTNYDILKKQCIPPRIYSLLSVLVKLTSDSLFVSSMNQLSATYSSWMHISSLEKHQQTVSLPCLFVAEILQIFSKNFSLYKDSTIHTYVLICLYNIIPSVHDMTSGLASRFIKIYEMITKQYLKIISQINKSFEFNQTGIEFKSGLQTISNLHDYDISQNEKSATEFEKDDYFGSAEILSLVKSSSQSFSEFMVYSDTHYMFSLILFLTLNKFPEKNSYLVYELVRTKSVLVNLLNPNILCYVNQNLLSVDEQQNQYMCALTVNKLVSILHDLADFIANNIKGSKPDQFDTNQTNSAALTSSPNSVHELTSSFASTFSLLSPKETLLLVKKYSIEWKKNQKLEYSQNKNDDICIVEFNLETEFNTQFYNNLYMWAWLIAYKNDTFSDFNLIPDSTNLNTVLQFATMYQ